MSEVDQLTVKLPNAMTKSELLQNGHTPEAADRIMHERVFGAGHKHGPDGKPVEQGIGSEANPFKATHLEALKKEQERKANLNPNNAELIKQAVEAGVRAGLAAAKRRAEQTEDEDF
jgi:hypothetical protein